MESAIQCNGHKMNAKGKAKDAFGQLEKRILRVVAKKKE
jgi:hypothetical protein